MLTITVFEEKGYWRWRIECADGTVFVDGGNFRTRRQALDGLADTLTAIIEEEGLIFG